LNSDQGITTIKLAATANIGCRSALLGVRDRAIEQLSAELLAAGALGGLWLRRLLRAAAPDVRRWGALRRRVASLSSAEVLTTGAFDDGFHGAGAGPHI